jgi:hypothetical protein
MQSTAATTPSISSELVAHGELLSESQRQDFINESRTAWPSGFAKTPDRAMTQLVWETEVACIAAISRGAPDAAKGELLTVDQREAILAALRKAWPVGFEDTPHKALSKLCWKIERACIAGAETANQQAQQVAREQVQQQAGLAHCLLSELRAARRAIRQIKRTTNEFDEAREICVKAEKRATAAIEKYTAQTTVATEVPLDFPLGSPVLDDVTRALTDAHDVAMRNCVTARMPECGDFAAIAQNLAYVLQEQARTASTDDANVDEFEAAMGHNVTNLLDSLFDEPPAKQPVQHDLALAVEQAGSAKLESELELLVSVIAQEGISQPTAFVQICKWADRRAATAALNRAAPAVSIDHDAFWVLVATAKRAKPGAEYRAASAALVNYVNEWAGRSELARPSLAVDAAVVEALLTTLSNLPSTASVSELLSQDPHLARLAQLRDLGDVDLLNAVRAGKISIRAALFMAEEAKAAAPATLKVKHGDAFLALPGIVVEHLPADSAPATGAADNEGAGDAN